MYILINEKLLFWHKPCNNGSKSQLFQVQLACKKYLRNCSETWSLPRQTGGLKEVYTVSDSLFVISFNQWWREMLCNPRGIYFEFKHELLDGFLSFITMMGLYIHRNGLFIIFNRYIISKPVELFLSFMHNFTTIGGWSSDLVSVLQSYISALHKVFKFWWLFFVVNCWNDQRFK